MERQTSEGSKQTGRPGWRTVHKAHVVLNNTSAALQTAHPRDFFGALGIPNFQGHFYAAASCFPLS
jgi:hypothetical protein